MLPSSQVPGFAVGPDRHPVGVAGDQGHVVVALRHGAGFPEGRVRIARDVGRLAGRGLEADDVELVADAGVTRLVPALPGGRLRVARRLDRGPGPGAEYPRRPGAEAPQLDRSGEANLSEQTRPGRKQEVEAALLLRRRIV
jgi:hypothetical protein